MKHTYRVFRSRALPLLLLAATLGGGLGLVMLVGSVADAILLRPLSFGGEPSRFVSIWFTSRSMRRTLFTYDAFVELQSHNTSFEYLAAAQRDDVVVTGRQTAVRAACSRVSGWYFQVMALPPALGRLIGPPDDHPESPKAAVISHALWKERFGGEVSAVGQTILVDGVPYSIVGVADRRLGQLKTDIWVPLSPFMDSRTERNRFVVTVRGRLAQGIGQRVAQAQLSQFAEAFGQRYRDTNGGLGAVVLRSDELVVETVRAPVLRLFAGSAVILCVCWMHLFSVFLLLVLERVREAGIRLALGAARGDLWWLFLREVGPVTVAAWLLALVFARVGITYFVAHAPNTSIRFAEVTLAPLAIWGTLVLSLGTAIVLAAWLSSKLAGIDLARVINDRSPLPRWGARGNTRNPRPAYWLLASQIAISAGVTICADYLLREYGRLDGEQAGFAAQTVTARIALPQARYAEPASRIRFVERVVNDLRSVPGGEHASAVLRPPLALDQWFKVFEAEGRVPGPGEWDVADYVTAMPGYFETVGIPMLAGREFSDRDTDRAQRVAIVDERFAAEIWPHQTAVGKRIRLGRPADKTRDWAEVVGVAAHVRDDVSQQNPLRYELYVPYAQDPDAIVAFVARSRRPYLDTVASVRAAVQRLDPEVPVFLVSTLADLSNDSLAARLAATQLLGLFSVLALALGVVGTYGVVSGAVAGRERELLIRQAVGASRADIVLLVARDTLLSVMAGTAGGGMVVFLASKLLTSVWAGFGAVTWVEYAVALPLVGLSAALACLLPAGLRAREANVASLMR